MFCGGWFTSVNNYKKHQLLQKQEEKYPQGFSPSSSIRGQKKSSKSWSCTQAVQATSRTMLEYRRSLVSLCSNVLLSVQKKLIIWGFVVKIVNLMLMWAKGEKKKIMFACSVRCNVNNSMNHLRKMHHSNASPVSNFGLLNHLEMMDSCGVMTRLGLLALGTLLWANTYCWVCLCMSTPLWKDSLSPWMSNLGLLALQKDPLVCFWKQTPSVWIWRGTPHPFNSVFGESLTLGVSDPMER